MDFLPEGTGLIHAPTGASDQLELYVGYPRF